MNSKVRELLLMRPTKENVPEVYQHPHRCPTNGRHFSNGLGVPRRTIGPPVVFDPCQSTHLCSQVLVQTLQAQSTQHYYVHSIKPPARLLPYAPPPVVMPTFSAHTMHVMQCRLRSYLLSYRILDLDQILVRKALSHGFDWSNLKS